MKIGELKIWQLSEQMRSHLAWYLDHHTCIGMITAAHIARGDGEYNNATINEILEWGGVTKRMIRIHANKIMKYGKGNPQL